MSGIWISIPVWITAVGIWINVYVNRKLHKLYMQAVDLAYKRGYRDGAARGLSGASWGQVAQETGE